MLRFSLMILLLIALSINGLAQVQIKLFSARPVSSAFFRVSSGQYQLEGGGKKLTLQKGDCLSISCVNGSLKVDASNYGSLSCSSFKIYGDGGENKFSISSGGKSTPMRNYSGKISCFASGTNIILLNSCSVEDYIAGVVQAEGGSRQNQEYYKTQAVLARTYLVRYLKDNQPFGSVVSDDKHCQVFFGITEDKNIMRAVLETKGEVIMGGDSLVIESAFHSNCGGETSSSEDVWLIQQPYLKKVNDPYCTHAQNSRWERQVSVKQWVEYLVKSGYGGPVNDPAIFGFLQEKRLVDYSAAHFSIPFTRIRSEMHLPSAFFSVIINGDSVILKGKGFGHGVGLCQEGAMEMAREGFNYRQIIAFYFSGVTIHDISETLLPRGLLSMLNSVQLN